MLFVYGTWGMAPVMVVPPQEPALPGDCAGKMMSPNIKITISVTQKENRSELKQYTRRVTSWEAQIQNIYK